MALVYWLERRYRFAVFIAIGWALIPWGVPFYLPIIGYILLTFLFLPIRIHDIRRIGGALPCLFMGSWNHCRCLAYLGFNSLRRLVVSVAHGWALGRGSFLLGSWGEVTITLVQPCVRLAKLGL